MGLRQEAENGVWLYQGSAREGRPGLAPHQSSSWAHSSTWPLGKGSELGLVALEELPCRPLRATSSNPPRAPEPGDQAQVIHLPAGTCPGQIPAESFLLGLDVDGSMPLALGFVALDNHGSLLASVLSSVNRVGDPKSLKMVMAGKPLWAIGPWYREQTLSQLAWLGDLGQVSDLSGPQLPPPGSGMIPPGLHAWRSVMACG